MSDNSDWNCIRWIPSVWQINSFLLPFGSLFSTQWIRNFHIPCMFRTQSTTKKNILISYILLLLTVSLSQGSYISLFQHVKLVMTILLHRKSVMHNFTYYFFSQICECGRAKLATPSVLSWDKVPIYLFVLL